MDSGEEVGQMAFFCHAVRDSRRGLEAHLKIRERGRDDDDDRDQAPRVAQVLICYVAQCHALVLLRRVGGGLPADCILPADGGDAIDDKLQGQREEQRLLHCQNRSPRLLDQLDRRVEVRQQPDPKQDARQDAKPG